MRRVITSSLLSWKKQHNRKPLIIRGARQVGKSWSVSEFGRSHFEGKLHLVNLEKRPDWHSLFERNLDAIRILSELEIVLNTRIEAGKDLLFFDEIQACPKAISSLRYFYEQLPSLHIIAAGSLLEFALADIPFPVGRVQMMNMYPMSFVEYLWAIGKERLAELVMAEPTALSPPIHELMQEELKRYFFVGGMPECVRTFAETENILDVQQVQTDLIDTYRQDFSKYAPYSDKRCLNDVLVSVASKVGQQIKYTGLSSDFSGVTNKKAFDLLSTARLIHKVRATSPAGLPLGAGASEKKFKAIMLDIGLLTRLSGLSLSVVYPQKQLLSIFKGALAEQFVGQELLANGQEELFYWSREAKSSNAEVDYLVAKDGAITPLEVKKQYFRPSEKPTFVIGFISHYPTSFCVFRCPFWRNPGTKASFFPFVLCVFGFSKKPSLSSLNFLSLTFTNPVLLMPWSKHEITGVQFFISMRSLYLSNEEIASLP